MRQSHLNPEFVEFIPEQLEDGVLYISMTYAVVSHKCVCGCGHEVVTPLSPTDWQLFFDGRGVSLSPSIGNWSIACRSHYWIRDNNVDWAANMSSRVINQGRVLNKILKEQYYAPQEDSCLDSVPIKKELPDKNIVENKKSWWLVFLDYFFRRR